MDGTYTTLCDDITHLTKTSMEFVLLSQDFCQCDHCMVANEIKHKLLKKKLIPFQC